MASNIEASINHLMNEIAKRKKAIRDAQTPKWETSGTLSLTRETDVHKRVNIMTVTDPTKLMELYGALNRIVEDYHKGVTSLGWDEAPEYSWQSYTLDEWRHDFKLRLSQILLAKRKKELGELEDRLESVMNVLAPEIKAKIELESIKNALK